MKKTIITWSLIVVSITINAQNKKIKMEFNKQVDSLFSSIYQKANEPGAAVLIMKDDKKIFEKCYGIADITSKTPITPRTNFCIASVSKQFSAVAIMQLAERSCYRWTTI